MYHLHKSVFFFAASLSALAVFVDAAGFLYLGGYFISFMSGNSTRLAIQIAGGDTAAAIMLSGILAFFILGVMSGTFIRHRIRQENAATFVLAWVAALLFAAACAAQMGWSFAAVACMVIAMGSENAILQRDGEVLVGLTYMTGTLVKIGQRLAGAFLGGPHFAWVPYLLLWAGLMIGGITGATLFMYMGLQSLWIAAAWAALLTPVCHRLRHRLI